ncbi:MAG TPA: ATPase domain-containing protein, partial [Chlamydiales bacterium]|nr:ATPase domain-containing protein [Chlamydiales bacterium]
MKLKSVWYCTSCGSKFIKWAGQCSGCQAWNTLQEEVEAASKPAKDFGITRAPQKPIRLSEVSERPIARHKTHMAEFDRLVGGGIVPGSLTLLGGEPGIGKSTLSLQLAHTFTKQGATVLYISGEESLEQTSMRAKRLDINGDLLYLLAETEVSAIIRHVEVIKPVVLIVDSIQIVYKAELPAAPG